MDADFITFLGREVLLTALKLAAPMLIAGMAVGIFFAFFQSITSVQEQTMSLVPKMLAVMLVTLLLLAPALQLLSDYTARVFGQLVEFGLG